MSNTSLPNHSSKEIVDNEKSKKKLPSCMYDDFHAHLVETNLKTQASNMHKIRRRRWRRNVLTSLQRKDTGHLVSKFTSLRSVKDMDSITCWKWLCCFAHVMKEVGNTSKDYKKDEKGPEGFLSLFLCSHLSMVLDRNPEADLRLSCLLHVSMIVIFVPCMNKVL